MPKYVKWEVTSKSQNDYNIGNKNYSFGKQGISTVDIIIIVIAVIAIISSVFFLYKNLVAINKVTKEISDMQSSIEIKQRTIQRLAELGNNEQALLEEYGNNKIMLPVTKNSEGIMEDIDSIINKEGATFINLQYAEEIKLSNGVIDIPFVLKIQGSYEQTNRILASFGKTLRLYVIDSVNSIKTDNNSVLINTEIIMHTYYKPN